MKAFVYVEGESDRLALQALHANWLKQLRAAGHGIAFIPLGGKSKFFERIGRLAAEKLTANEIDLVIGLPDLYPNAEFRGTGLAHADFAQLQTVQRTLVSKSLSDAFNVRTADAAILLNRFYPSALKHDLEMLLLAAVEQLRAVLGTTDNLGIWRKPVEDQDQAQPPKRIVEELFLTKSAERRAYRETQHAPSVLRAVQNVRDILYTHHGQLTCPVFKAMLDWLGKRFGLPAYT